MKNLRKPITSFVFLLCIILFNTQDVNAQESGDYAVHANIIYRFTKYVNWPEDKKGGDFIIGIVGDTPLFDELKSFVSNKNASGRKIIIRKFSASASSFPCHILFIGEDGSGSLKKIASATAGTSVLLVTEAEGLARKGSCINFVLVQDHLKLEINKVNIEQRKLDIANELLSLGKIVK